jgi:hypothetical protein
VIPISEVGEKMIVDCPVRFSHRYQRVRAYESLLSRRCLTCFGMTAVNTVQSSLASYITRKRSVKLKCFTGC